MGSGIAGGPFYLRESHADLAHVRDSKTGLDDQIGIIEHLRRFPAGQNKPADKNDGDDCSRKSHEIIGSLLFEYFQSSRTSAQNNCERMMSLPPATAVLNLNQIYFMKVTMLMAVGALVIGHHAFAGDKPYAADAAEKLMAEACATAKKESKLVFVASGFKECGWCRVFEKYHALPDVSQILGKYYVNVKIDTTYMPDGKEVFSKMAKPGAPSWVIVTPDRKPIIDSYAEKGNVGYPAAPHEIAHYVKAL